jgi:hypothetical protein
MRDGSALLDVCPVAGSEEWADAVRTWAQLEEAYRYQTSVSESYCACEYELTRHEDGSTTLETRLKTSGGRPVDQVWLFDYQRDTGGES